MFGGSVFRKFVISCFYHTTIMYCTIYGTLLYNVQYYVRRYTMPYFFFGNFSVGTLGLELG